MTTDTINERVKTLDEILAENFDITLSIDGDRATLTGSADHIYDLLHRASAADFACSHYDAQDQIVKNEIGRMKVMMRKGDDDLKTRLLAHFDAVREKYPSLKSRRKPAY
jgi:hypothetical protein